MQKNQSGFSAIAAIVIILAVLAVGGLIVWRVYDSNKPALTNGQQSQNTRQTDPNEGYVVIKEWGVRFKPVESLTGVQYFKPASVTTDSISITTDELMTKEPDCGKISTQPVIGLLTRSKTSNQENGGVIAEINGYTYSYRASGAACSQNDENLALESQTGTRIINSIKSLEVAK